MKTLKLRLLKKKYKRVIKGEREVYFNENQNNLIVFDPLDEECDTASICNGIAEDAYRELIDHLNDYSNIVVHWSQVEGTTSDYTIFHDMDSAYLIRMTVDEILEAAYATIKSSRLYSCKYTEVLDGVENKIEFNRN
ncbi:hypothetical protein [Bacillus infantis]|uniref:hypothetical protein n=1 Tax=Bacillus infantis TaxID=324767 RepID=UPI00209F51A4|nr:hypothetical protein [Bacillus infantis]MCP1159406.1 hypothetical protein [Bacillus infantis]